ncbi:MAG: PHP domain-containing protein [Candidatus Erginobacter occultus]|nr:PHP domain-containing protein [Candidatus Erginobacter occultus]
MTPENLRADLHIHTLASDGAATAEEVLAEARQAGMAAISITDHDSVDAVGEAVALAPRYGVEVVPGIEISVDVGETEMHLLGYFIDYRDPELCRRLSYFRQIRAERADRMLEILDGMGFPLDMEALLPGQMTGSIGRLHIAQALVRAGYVKSPGEAFARYIGNDGPAYVEKLKIGVEEAMEMILRTGGAPVLAHPGQFDRDELIPGLIEKGLVGLEAYYPSHSRFAVNHYLELARHYGLAATGGSDSHGLNKENVRIGSAAAPYSVVAQLRDRAARGK